MRVAVVIAALAAQPVFADSVGGGRVIDCYCTDTDGGRVELGETICLFVNRRAFMAQCQMSLNVPMWREVSEGCPGAALRPDRQSRPDRIAPL